jgi:hypothetical protein
MADGTQPAAGESPHHCALEMLFPIAGFNWQCPCGQWWKSESTGPGELWIDGTLVERSATAVHTLEAPRDGESADEAIQRAVDEMRRPRRIYWRRVDKPIDHMLGADGHWRQIAESDDA